MPEQNIQELLNRFFQGTITPAEKDELMHWIEQSKDEREFAGLVEESWQQFEPGQTLPADKAGLMLQAILHAKDSQPAKLVTLPGRKWWRIAAAAVILVIAGSTTWLLLSPSPKELASTPTIGPVKQDVSAPGSVNAVLTLANGQQVILDSMAIGQLASQGNAQVVKMADDQLAYNNVAGMGTVQYNTLTVPRGSKIVNLRLADGTAVVMNAGSSITFPTAFVSKERKVEITGEAYFEVAKDVAKKFIVTTNGVTTEVLGTHFNINAYSDQGTIDVTLLEGKVKVAGGAASAMLSPGQQAQLNKEGKIGINENPDTDEIMAWKNGLFNFNSLSIQSIMLQISRWYDVEVTYEGKISEEHFSGIVSRNDNVSEVLKLIELAGVKFRIEGKKIIVM
ncbi:FecR family protein [Flavihumibacter solisilvae]|uniref:Iron dicitrate transport regulator FecR n=1 Tax=Flavihumibacter solisilvae TaxID=1349421 RepID=A0A0C1IMJ3_9BACT|nr:FecR family protein [Flavihumibacter solisilvae]KIC95455.1 hypothetical protein OI18_06110 [Flavihumibacter solisilvae]